MLSIIISVEHLRAVDFSLLGLSFAHFLVDCIVMDCIHHQGHVLSNAFRRPGLRTMASRTVDLLVASRPFCMLIIPPADTSLLNGFMHLFSLQKCISSILLIGSNPRHTFILVSHWVRHSRPLKHITLASHVREVIVPNCDRPPATPNRGMALSGSKEEREAQLTWSAVVSTAVCGPAQ